MQPSNVTVRQAERSEVPAVAAVLATAFDSDPLMRFVIPSDGHRQRVAALFSFEAALTPA